MTAKALARRIQAVCFVVAVLAVFPLQAETPLPLPNAGFEDGETVWDGLDSGFAQLSAEAAHTGKLGLRVTDESDKAGSSIRSRAIPVAVGRPYAVRFWARSVRRQGLGVYVEFRDGKGALITDGTRHDYIILAVPGRATAWTELTIAAEAPKESASLSIWLHSFNATTAIVDVDDFAVSELTDEEAKTVRTTEVAIVSEAPVPIPDPARIARIAAMLPAEPRGIGFPITDREHWDRLAQMDRAAGILRQAEGIAATPPPELPDDLYLEFTRTGNRRNYEVPYAQTISRIERLVVAECLENRGRFVSPLERDILAMCNNRSWLLPACDPALTNFKGTQPTVALGSSYRAWMLATTLYWLGDRLSPEVRDRTRTEIRQRVLDPYLAALRAGSVRGNWWMTGTNNWNAVCTAGVVGTALAMVPSPQERAEYLAGMEISLPYFLNGFADDGYCTEGVGYWGYGFGRFMMLGLMARDATGGEIDIFADPKVATIARFPLNILIEPGIAPAFADCGVNAKPAPDILVLISRVFPDLLGGRRRLADSLSGSILLLAFHALVDDETVPPMTIAPGNLPLHSWFPDGGVLVSRDQPEAEIPFGAAIKGGNNAESHNHNDVGSYAVVVAGRPLLCDPGNEVYTRRTFSARRYESKVLNSYGHPVPVVGGTLQARGPKACARILETDFSPTRDRLAMDIASAYPVAGLQSLVRTFEHDRTARTIRIEDRVRFSQPTAFADALISQSRVHRLAEDRFAVYDENNALEIQVAVEGSPWEYACEEIENPGRPTPRRLGINLTQPVTEARICFTIRPSPAAGLPGIYAEPVWRGIAPDPTKAVTVQAEDFVEQTGSEVEACDKVGAEGKALKFWFKPNHRLTWRFEVPSAGRYAVRLRCCHIWKGEVTRTVELDGRAVSPRPFLFPSTGGWSSTEDNWRDVWLSQEQKPLVLTLPAGFHTLSMNAPTETGLNLDWLQLVPVSDK